MATFHFDLVSPEKLLFSGEVDQVDMPGSEGDFGVLAGHAPTVSALRPGIMTVYVNGQRAAHGRARRLRRGLGRRQADGAGRSRRTRSRTSTARVLAERIAAQEEKVKEMERLARSTRRSSGSIISSRSTAPARHGDALRERLGECIAACDLYCGERALRRSERLPKHACAIFGAPRSAEGLDRRDQQWNRAAAERRLGKRYDLVLGLLQLHSLPNSSACRLALANDPVDAR